MKGKKELNDFRGFAVKPSESHLINYNSLTIWSTKGFSESPDTLPPPSRLPSYVKFEVPSRVEMIWCRQNAGDHVLVTQTFGTWMHPYISASHTGSNRQNSQHTITYTNSTGLSTGFVRSCTVRPHRNHSRPK
jgi:hypothetical protein